MCCILRRWKYCKHLNNMNLCAHSTTRSRPNTRRTRCRRLEKLGAGLRLHFLLFCCAQLVVLLVVLLRVLLVFVLTRVCNVPEVDDSMEARVVEEAPPVKVAEDAHVVGAVRKQRVPLARVRELDRARRKMAKNEKNRSTRRSTPRHPIDMVSTAMHWPRSCCQSCAPPPAIYGKPCFRGRPRIHATVCVLGPCLHAGCDHAACIDGGIRGNYMGAGGRCLASRVGGVRWRGPTGGRARLRRTQVSSRLCHLETHVFRNPARPI